jgi:uncharacterized protein
MTQLFLGIYDYFQKHRTAFWISFVIIVGLLSFAASRIKVEEDISRFFPDDERVKKIDYVLKNSSFSERLTVMISFRDSTAERYPDSLVQAAESLITKLHATISPYVHSISSTVDDSNVLTLFKSVIDNLPVFLTAEDYNLIDSLIQPSVADQVLQSNYRQLISPAGLVTKNIIVNDPLGFSFVVLKKLQELQLDKNFELYDNYILTRDHRHLLFFIHPKYPSSDTGHNLELIDELDRVFADHGISKTTASYFGGVAVAVGNAKQLQRDSVLTISLTVLLLAGILVGYFRKKRAPFFILIPVVFGGLFALAFTYLMQGSISIIAIAAGSIILGIAVNYSLHFFVHAEHTKSARDTIQDLAHPMTVGSATTVLAFLSLQFVNASVLQDLGLFAALSLVGAALCTLIFLPQVVSSFTTPKQTENRLAKLKLPRLLGSGLAFAIILILTPFFFHYAQQVEFDDNIANLNFMKPELRAAQRQLEDINQATLASSYIVAQNISFQKALEQTERTTPLLHELQSAGAIQKFSSISSFIVSDSLQNLRLTVWNNYWNSERVQNTIDLVSTQGKKLNYSDRVFENFKLLLTKQYSTIDSSIVNRFRTAFFDDFIIEKDGLTTIVTVANVNPSSRDQTYESLQRQGVQIFDRQMITNLFVEYVHADFNFIVAFTSGLVFIALLIVYGRIELTLITFLPMLITWIWILGIMALVGIKFNIVNIMISTFIFGLGDDYSIFTMDCLQQQYKTGKQNLASVRVSIFLSAVTTIVGLGVLIFAQHPALWSIAAISIIGIVCVFVMSQTVEPFLFRWLITNRTERKLPPMTFFGLVKTIFTYGFFVSGSILLTLIGVVLKPIPLRASRFVFHSLLRFFTWTLIALTPKLKRTILDRDLFQRPSVIISNHSSFLDILLTIGLHPKIILLTNKWVWNSPVFGGVVRLADYYPVTEGAEESITRLANRINEGYSIVVFPEGTRSADSTIGRFHKGAFFIAESLDIPVQPLLIHGACDAIPKNTMYVNNGELTLRFLPAISGADKNYGSTYTERAKLIGKYFKAEFSRLATQERTPRYFRHKLIANYLYKGPVVEWYTRIKLRVENYYEPFHTLIPFDSRVLDLGCGYGYLPYMLHFLSSDRKITGVDYDEEKIQTASNNYSKSDRLIFFCADITSFPMETYDVIVIADVLHYLQPAVQDKLIARCVQALDAGGKLIIREGNADLQQRHAGTRITELFSVKILKFNKSVNKLHFLSGDRLTRLVSELNCSVRTLDETKFTSNVIFVVEKKT